MRLGLVAALCLAIFGGVYLLMGRTPEDRVVVPTPPAEAKASPRQGLLAARSPHATSKPAGPAVRRFVGEHFSIQYPAGWRIETAEVSKGAYFDTTIRSPDSPSTYLRVDVTPERGTDPAVHAAEVEAYLKVQQGYSRRSLERTKHGRLPAVRWEFDVVESGLGLRKVDVFLTDADGDRIAVLTQAPASEFAKHARLFELLRTSLVPRA